MRSFDNVLDLRPKIRAKNPSIFESTEELLQMVEKTDYQGPLNIYAREYKKLWCEPIGKYVWKLSEEPPTSASF